MSSMKPGRPARKHHLPELSPGDAHAVIRWLYALGKVTARDIRTALRERDSLVSEVTGRLEDLGGVGERFLKRIDASPRAADAEIGRARTSVKERAAWRAECRLRTILATLPRKARNRVRAIRESRGLGAAITAARRLAEH
jgi:hypothetical protein